MPGRRLIILLVVLLITLSVLSATRDVSRTSLPGVPNGRRVTTAPTTTTTTPRTTTAKAEAQPAPPAPTVTVRLPGRGSSRVPLGAHVIVRVSSSRPEIVSVDGLGVRSPVGPGTPGTLDFVAPQAGRYPVTLAISGRRIGEIVVGG